MAFQGIKQQGTDPLQLFLAIRQLRQQEEADKQTQTLARVKAAQDAEKFRLDAAIKAADLQAKQAQNAQIIADMRANADAEFTPADVSIPGGGAESQAFGSIVSGLDPAGIQRGVNAQAALTDALRPGMQSGRSVESLLGGAAATTRAQGRERMRATDAEIAKENRAEARTKRQEDRAQRRKIDDEIRTERRRAEAEEKARANGYWDKKDLIAERNSIDKQLTKPTRLLNEGWNALDEFEKEGDAKRYLEIVQRWIRKVDEGATVREGDIALVDTFSMSGWEKLKAFILGVADAEGRVTQEAKDSIASAFRQILEESDRGLSEEWGDRIAYADEQNWNDRERAMAIPRITAVRRMVERHESRQLRGIALDYDSITDADKAAAERRIRRRLNIRRGAIKDSEVVNELKKMALERQNQRSF